MARRTIYRMKQDANGKKHYYIYAERQWVEVEKDVYLLYACEDRKNRRRIKKEQEMGIEFISYEKLMDDYNSDDSVTAFIPAPLLSRSTEDDYFGRDELSDDAEFLAWFEKKKETFPIDKKILLKVLAESNYSGLALAERMRVPTSSMYYYLRGEFESLVQQYYREVGR